MDAKFINPVLSTIVNVFSTMASLEPKAGKPTLKNDNKARGVVTGIIAMEGDKATGSIAISFTKPVILDLVKRMLREEKTEVDDMAKDLTGEIANMIMGGAKGILENDGYNFGMSLPEVLSGTGHTINHPVNGPNILLPFVAESGEFFVEICFAKQN